MGNTIAKKYLAFVLALALVCTTMIGVHIPASAAEDAVIEISDEEDLRAINDDPTAHYKLVEDITLSDRLWTPISNFSGTLDGNGHVIRNMNIEETTENWDTPVGFISTVGTGAVIKNLGVEGTITCSASTVGGLVGENIYQSENITIENCYTNVAIKDNLNYPSICPTIGGLIGGFNGESSVMRNCYAVGTIEAFDNHDPWSVSTIGGIIGSYADVDVSNCYTTESRGIGNDPTVGHYGNVQNCYAMEEGDADMAGHLFKIPDDMSSFLAALNQNGDNAYVADFQNINMGYPVLTWQYKKDAPEEDGSTEIKEPDTPAPSKPTNNNKPSDNNKPVVDEPAAPVAVGSTVSDSATKAVYKVTEQNGSENTVEYVGSSAKKASVVIPATVTIQGKTYKVTTIGKKAFAGNKALKKVVIGKNIKTIGSKAFSNCKKLKTIKIKTTKLTKKSLGVKAFKGINKKVKINVPNKKAASYKKILLKKGVTRQAVIK